jgi:hypothetical protein
MLDATALSIALLVPARALEHAHEARKRMTRTKCERCIIF